MKFHKVSSFAVAFSLTLLFSFSASAAKDKTPIVFVKKAKLSELSESLSYPARIEAKIRAQVTSEADGVVAKIRAPLGKRVNRGAALMVIRNTDPVFQYSPMVITSPVTGVVSQVEVTEGSRVSRGDKLALVTDPTQVQVSVEVAAADVRYIQAGMVAEMILPGEAEPLKAKVKGISPFVDPGTGTASCELEIIKKKDLILPPGLLAKVQFKVNTRKGFSIPDSALTYRGKDPFVRVIVDGKSKLTAIKIGRKQAGFVEVLSGLKEGDQVVERTSGFVADGEIVKIQSTEG